LRYEYSGYLKTLLEAPDAGLRDSLEHVEFSADDLEHWNLVDEDAEKEWQNIPAATERTDTGLILRGHFEDVRRIDQLDKDDPSFWVPLSSRQWKDERLPVDLRRYPVIELTYRCRTPKARPAWLWSYRGGVHFDGLQPTRDWRTISRLSRHFSFPDQIHRLTFRLYSTARSTEAMEIQSVRFRAMSPAEEAACRHRHEGLLEREEVPHYPLLDEFLPLGVFMKAGTAKRMAETMDIPFRDYWRLALEDIAQHHHNCVALEEMAELTQAEWRELLGLAESYGIRVLAIHEWPLDKLDSTHEALIEQHIKPYADSPAVLAWSVLDEPPGHTFQAHLQARKLIAAADPAHPLAVMMREPNSFPLFAPFFAATGISHYRSHAPWDIGHMVSTHYPLSRGQQFWVTAPAFVYATDTPDWNSCPEMRLMLNLAFANGTRGWFAFSYHNDPIWMGGHCQRSLTGPFLTFSDLWSELGQRFLRFSALAPLFLDAVPSDPPEVPVEIRCSDHPRSQRPPGVVPIQWHWLRGPDYTVLYVVSNDTGEVIPVYINLPEQSSQGLEAYDVTDFVRIRTWRPMARQRHLEMFPGQGQMILIAEPRVCAGWRDRIAAQMIAEDHRQMAIDVSLARRYDLDIAPVQQLMRQASTGEPLEGLRSMQEAKDQLLNMMYGAPAFAEPNSQLIQTCAAICGCDGSLCRLLGKGKVDAAHEWGLKVLPLSREVTHLRLQLRRGGGPQIHDEATALSQRTVRLLEDIRSKA